MAKPASAKPKIKKPTNWDPLPLEDRGPETLLTAEEAANYLGVPQRWMRQVGRNEIPVVKIGQRNRYRKSDLNAYIESRVEPPRNTWLK